ncbi:hypothetical protein EAF00_007504 [Botryotinia globosa]|nr:hypothetical protein EAF00_007504 [Botryotinia globosa]
MDPQGIHHRSTECELDHECDQEILEAIQKVYERLNQTGCKRYKLGHESDQVVQQTDQEQDNTRESVHSLDKIGSRESSGNEGSHESIVMKIQAMSIRRHYRGYTLPSNFRALDLEFRHHKWIWNFLHRRIVTVIIAAIDDAANNVDLPIEVPFLSCTSTLIPQKAGIIDPWSMDTREVAGGPCFFVLRGSRPVNGTATFVCMVSPEFDERLARSSQSTEYMQGKSSKGM